LLTMLFSGQTKRQLSHEMQIGEISILVFVIKRL
jgi:hypothetical protein